jgi:hypothetical protein
LWHHVLDDTKFLGSLLRAGIFCRGDRSEAILAKGYPVICFTDSEGVKHSILKDVQKLKPAVQVRIRHEFKFKI